jgi:predicted small metal-binding protein
MARELMCSDVGFACDAVIRADSDDEVMEQAAAHGKEVHGLTDEDLEREGPRIRAAIHDA